MWLSVIYINWNKDNAGLAENDDYKLFDFEASGISIDNKTRELGHVHYYAYGRAIDCDNNSNRNRYFLFQYRISSSFVILEL